MMKRYLFRAQCLDSRDWVQGSYLLTKNGFTESHYIHDGTIRWVIDQQTIGQFTGMLDQNGVPIFEGDQVLEEQNKLKYLVYFAEQKGCWKCIAKEGDEYGLYQRDLYPVNEYMAKKNRLTVIGNCHEISN